MNFNGDDHEYYECPVCCYGTDSYRLWLLHGQKHAEREKEAKRDELET